MEETLLVKCPCHPSVPPFVHWCILILLLLLGQCIDWPAKSSQTQKTRQIVLSPKLLSESSGEQKSIQLKYRWVSASVANPGNLPLSCESPEAGREPSFISRTQIAPDCEQNEKYSIHPTLIQRKKSSFSSFSILLLLLLLLLVSWWSFSHMSDAAIWRTKTE